MKESLVKKLFTKILASSLLLFASCASAQSDWLTTDGKTQVMNGVDDGTYHLQLEHAFPYYGGVFTDAWMSSNGVIILYDPTTGIGNPQTGNSMCCSGQNLSNWNTSQGNGFSYMLAPLWTDLRDPNVTPDDGYYVSTDQDGSSFLWYNVYEYGTTNTNTFQVDFYADGSFDFLYDEVDITQHSVFIGNTGDMNSGATPEVNQLQYAQGGLTEFDFEFPTTEFPGQGRAWYGQDGGYQSTGPDCSDPLNDASCPGYEQAYYDQQCSANPMYDSSCPGYAEAYYDQQCSADPLYDPYCPGYEQAYYDQQCNADPLYDASCPGYEQAYYDQQCSSSSLYDPGCPGYEQAYYDQQCSNDPLYDSGCPGYQSAYYDQQCSTNSLYDPGCPGYEQAYYDQQCSNDPLYDSACPGYEQAYYTQMCENNPAYDSGCPGNSDVQITPNLVEDSETERTESFAINIALQQALQHSGAGITIFGTDYSFNYRVGDNSSIDLNVGIEYDTNYAPVTGETIGQYSFTDPTNGYESFYERNLSYSGIPMEAILNFNMDFNLQGDAGVKDISAQMLFTGDFCTENALYSTTCQGYEEAYLAQQCVIVGPLYDSQCPGYEQAYFDQQCGISSLYDSQCPGYAEAYFDQQCGIDTLYDQGCPGYAEAYFDQQCGIDALYDEGCTGYAEAYYDQQCGIDALYDNGCPGYAEAYYDQQCSLDTLYDEGCPGYAEAYYDNQCSLDPLYDSGCPGYEQAYYDQQCSLDSLYDSGCPGYTDAVAELQFAASCTADPLYDSQCPGYDVAKQLADMEEQMAAQTATPSSTGMETQDASMGIVEEPVVEIVSTQSMGMPAQDNTGAEPVATGEPEPVAQAQASEPVVEATEAAVIAEVIEPVAQEETVAEPTPEPVVKEEVAVVEEKAVEEKAVEEKAETVEKKEKAAKTKKASVDVMSIVSDVLAAERELVANEVASAQSNSIAQSQSSSSGSGGSDSGALDSTGSSLSNGSTESLFDMDVTQSSALAGTQASTLDSNSAFGDSSSFAGGASNDSAASAGAQNLGDSLAAGGSISQALSNPGAPPGADLADVKPSPAQQQSTAKAESLAERMSTEEIEAIAERRANGEEEDEYGDQTLDVVIMNNGTDMNAYYSALELQKQSQQTQWYLSKDIYKNNKPRDNLGVFYSTAGKSEKMIRDMINQQFEEKK